MSLFNSGIRPVIDAHLLKLAQERRSYGEYWSASSAGYCQRRVIFDRLGVPHVSEDARKQRVFTAGHIFHDWIQELTREAGLSIAQEVELQDEDLMIRGHFDDLVLIERNFQPGDKMTGADMNKMVSDVPVKKQQLILYDYKTVNSRSFTWAKKNGGEMSYYHRLQLGTYMYMLKKKAKLGWEENIAYADTVEHEWQHVDTKDLKEARILKISKDDLRMDEQQLLWSDDLAKEVIDYWLELNDWWLKKKIPPCTCADHENGFLARPKFNPYYFEDEPCSLKWYRKWKKEQTDDTAK